MTYSDRHQLDAICRTSLFAFVWRVFSMVNPGEIFRPAWHVAAMVKAIEDAIAGRTPHLLITVPPRHLKSLTTSVALSAYLHGLDPSKKIMVVSYNQDLASELGRQTLTVMRHPDYQRMFPNTVLSDTRATPTDIQTTQHGHRYGVGVQGATTGFGCDVLIIDDLMKAIDGRNPEARQRAKDYYQQSLYSRLNNKSEGVIIAIQQRLDQDDFAAYLIEKGFHHLCLRAIAEDDEVFELPWDRHSRRRGEALFPEHEPLDRLEAIRAETVADFNAQWQQNPMQPADNALRWEDFLEYSGDFERGDFLYVIQSWDTAHSTAPTADWSVCITAGLFEGVWWILHIERARLDYPALKGRVRHMANVWSPDTILFELAGSGYSLVTELRSERGPLRDKVQAYQPFLSKEDRFAAQTDKIANGMVAIPNDAPWLPQFRQEITNFPSGRYDDQVDALAQMLEWISRGGGRGRLIMALRRCRPRSNGDEGEGC